MLVAEAGKDWALCVSMAPVVLEALGSGMSCLRADTLALAAKAAVLLHDPDALTSNSSDPSIEGRVVVAACEAALDSLRDLHGSSVEQLPRFRDLTDVLKEFRVTEGTRTLALLDVMD
jgi:hypothetical protein